MPIPITNEEIAKIVDALFEGLQEVVQGTENTIDDKVIKALKIILKVALPIILRSVKW